MKLLCDEMLARLGRWLRAAGYDTAIAPAGSDDAEIAALALAEQRLLLTCDRELAARHAGFGPALALLGNGVDAQASELSRRIGLDWMRAPFTRCLVDNAPLTQAQANALALLPPRARRSGTDINACPRCQRLYWPGSHVRRMAARLERWHAAGAHPASL